MGRYLAGAVLLLAASASPSDDEARAVALEWVAEPASVAATPLRFVATPPEGVAAPPGVREPRFARVALGHHAHLTIAIDAAAGRERIWIDHDFDGDLADDNRAGWSPSGSGWMREEFVVVPFGPHAHVKERFRLRVSARARPEPAYRLAIDAAQAGEVVLGGRARRFLLLDGNDDLRFDDADLDRLLVDLNGDGLVEAPRDLVTPGVPFRAGDEGWVAAVGFYSSVTFRRVAAPPPRVLRWRDVPAPPAGVPVARAPHSLTELRARFERETRESFDVRGPTVAAVGRVGSEEALTFLETVATEDGRTEVRVAAATAMGNPRFRPHAKRVAAIAERGHPMHINAAAAAIEALHAMDAPGRADVYRRLIESRRWRVMGAAARYLAYLPDESARRDALVACSAMRYASSTLKPGYEQWQAYRGIRTLPGGPPPGLMAEMAESSHPALRALALGDMATVGHPRTRELAIAATKLDRLIWNDMDPDAARNTNSYVDAVIAGRRALGEILVRVVGSFDDVEAVEGLRRLTHRVPLEQRAPLRDQLAARRRPECVEAVTRALRSNVAREREIAAGALARMGGEHVVSALLKRLPKERDLDALHALLNALGGRPEPAAQDALVRECAEGRLPGFALRAAARRPGDDRVRRLIRHGLDAGDADARVRALTAIAETGHPSLAPLALRHLGDESWSVRVAALDALRGARLRESVSPLIARLAEEPRLRLRLAIADMLFELTGMDLGDGGAPWQAWFEENGKTFEVPVPRPVRHAPRAGNTASFFGLPIDSDHATFAMDRSGSMGAPMGALIGAASASDEKPESRLSASIGEALGAARGMPDGAFVNLLLFHFEARAWKNKLVVLDRKNRKSLESRLKSGFVGAETDVYAALRKALSYPESDTILLLTDGLPTGSEFADPAKLLGAIRRMNETSRVAIHCVSLGRDSELLRRLAREHAGRFVRR